VARRLFYVDEVRGGRAWLTGETAEHLRKVLRAEAGQTYEISDNARLYLARIAGFEKRRVEFEVIESLPPRAVAPRLHLLASLVKFDRFEWILEKATELQVERITPVVALRSEKGLEQAVPRRMERWRRIVFESGQQSRRVTRPALETAVPLLKALETAARHRFWLDEAEGTVLLAALPAERAAEDEVALLTGPEGGWDDRERAAALAAGWRVVSLGAGILRAETACLAGLAVVGAAWAAGD
jgi:16S rRNA (uracil1498-N3)-methyltransferase